MKKIYKRSLFVVFVLISLFAFNLFLNWTYYNPAVIVPIYGWLEEHGFTGTLNKVFEISGEEALYPPASISSIQNNLFWGPRAAVIGTVSAIVKAPDRDTHINVKDQNSDRTLVAEMVPEYPLPLPLVGQKIKIWGVTRYDLEHRSWELHPVFGWEAAK